MDGILILPCLDRPATLLRSHVYSTKMVMLGIIEAYIGTEPVNVANFLEILYDVMILTERPEFDEHELLMMMRTRT